MNNQNIISNKFDLKQAIRVSYRSMSFMIRLSETNVVK